MKGNTVNVIKRKLQGELRHEGALMVKYRVDYPEFKGERYQLAIAGINRFYRVKAEEYKKYLETEFLGMAIKQYEEMTAQGFPFNPYDAVTEFRVTYNRVCILSLYFDKYEYTGGAHGTTLRTSQTWNLQRCGRIKLDQLFRCAQDYRPIIFKEVIAQIEKNPQIYFEDYKKLVVKTLNPESFYCTPHGIVVYYQQYDIAPYSSGIREFLIPYTNCILDPAKTCFKV